MKKKFFRAYSPLHFWEPQATEWIKVWKVMPAFRIWHWVVSKH